MKLSKNKIIKLKKKKHQSYKNHKNNNKNHKNKNKNKNHKKTYTKKGKKNFNVRYNTIKNRKKKKRGGSDSIFTKQPIFEKLDLTEIKSVTKDSYLNLIKINYDIDDDTRTKILDEPKKIFFDIDNGFIYVSESYTNESNPYNYFRILVNNLKKLEGVRYYDDIYIILKKKPKSITQKGSKQIGGKLDEDGKHDEDDDNYMN